MAGQLGALRVAPHPTRMQVVGQAVRPLENLRIAEAPFALNDQVAVAYRVRDGRHDRRNRELRCGVVHFLSYGWWGSSRTINPLASVSTVPSVAVMVAAMKTFLPSSSLMR